MNPHFLPSQQHPLPVLGLQAAIPTLEALELVLQQETQTYSQVVQTMEKKRNVLAEGNYADLPPLDQDLLQLGQQALQLEQHRIGLMPRLEQSQGEPNITLQQIIARIQQPEAKNRLQSARVQLLEIIERINSVNQTNKRLLHHAIKWVDETLETVNVAISPEPASYTAAGQKQRNKPNASNPTQSTVICDA